MIELEVRNVPAHDIVDCLVDDFAGTEVRPNELVAGDGWEVWLKPGEPARLGRGRVPVLFLRIDGARQDAAATFLRRRTMRGGG